MCERGEFIEMQLLKSKGNRRARLNVLAVAIIFWLSFAAHINAQTPDAETQRTAAIKKAEFLTDRMRPNADGQPLNWANETDRREIVRRFTEGAKWWHIAGDHANEFDALSEVVRGYQALKDFPAALDALNLALAAALEADRAMLKFAALNGIGENYRLMNNERRAVEYFQESLLILQSSKLRDEWLAQNQTAERAAAILTRYEKSPYSRAEILDRQTTIDISEARVLVLINQTKSYQSLGALEKAAAAGEQTLTEARRAQQTGVSAYGYGEIFKFARRAAQLQFDAGNRPRAAQLIKQELTVAAGNTALEKDLNELLKLIESGSKTLKGDDNWQTHFSAN